jgi:hypothetical protein
MKLKMRYGVVVIALTILIIPAFADAVFTLGDHPQPNEENILFHPAQMGTTIDGITNHSHTMVQFSSTTDTLIASGGQSDVDAVDGDINDITMSVPGHTFLDAIINPFKEVGVGNLVVTVTMSNGMTFTHTYGAAHGDNFLTITTSGGEMISSVNIESGLGFQGLKQPRISGISGVTVVPEPSSMLLLGSGVLGLAYALRRKML